MCWTPKETMEVLECSGLVIAGLLILLFVGIPVLRGLWGIGDE